MKTMRYISTSLTATALALLMGTLSGCGTLDLPGLRGGASQAADTPEVAAQPTVAEAETIPPPQEKPKPGKLYDWQGDGRQVSRVVIDLDEQRANFYDGNEQIGWATVATGLKAFPTPTGQFEVIEKVANKRSNLYGKIYNKAGRVIKSDARQGRDEIPEGGRFAGAEMPYFMRLTYDGVGLHAGAIPRPGHPASHGCIRLPKTLAPVLFAHVGYGTPVTIVGSGPSYGNYVEKMRIAAARERAAAERAAEEAARAPQVTLASGEPEPTSASAVPDEPGQPPAAPDEAQHPPASEAQVATPKTEPAAASPSSPEILTDAIPATTTPPEPTSAETAPPTPEPKTNPEGGQPPAETTPEPTPAPAAAVAPEAQVSPVPLTAIPALPGAVERYGP